jgi:hypothetical protein
MGQGFTPEIRKHAMNVNIWVEGAPERSFWTGIRTRGRKQLDIETWRCDRCYYLESYAPPNEDG